LFVANSEKKSDTFFGTICGLNDLGATLARMHNFFSHFMMPLQKLQNYCRSQVCHECVRADRPRLLHSINITWLPGQLCKCSRLNHAYIFIIEPGQKLNASANSLFSQTLLLVESERARLCIARFNQLLYNIMDTTRHASELPLRPADASLNLDATRVVFECGIL
jgi:hypothetical protein